MSKLEPVKRTHLYINDNDCEIDQFTLFFDANGDILKIVDDLEWDFYKYRTASVINDKMDDSPIYYVIYDDRRGVIIYLTDSKEKLANKILFS